MPANLIEARPIAGAIGAEVHGVDLGAEVGDATIAGIRRAWLEHCVLFFRQQRLTPAQFLGFAKRFGEIVEYPFSKGIEGFPAIIPVVKLEHEKTNFGGVWHSDTSYLPQPPMATLLIAREVPARRHPVCQYLPRLCDTVGGHEAPARGTDRRQQLAEGRCEPDPRGSRQRHAAAGCQEGIPRRASGGAHASGDGSQGTLRQFAHTLRFKDMTEAESAPLLDFLCQQQTRPEFTCRFRWQVGSIAFWDNRCAQHNPVNDYHGYRRAMQRITLAGDTPR